MTYAVQIPEDWYPPRWQLLRRHIESRGNTFLGFRVACDVHGQMYSKRFSGAAFCTACLDEQYPEDD